MPLSKIELRNYYTLIKCIMEAAELTTEKKLEVVKMYKKCIRESRDYEEKYADEQPHYTDELGESCWYKEWFDEPFTEEGKRALIKNHWISINSPYDCTGQWFTRSIEIFNVETSFGAKSVVYYFMGKDV